MSRRQAGRRYKRIVYSIGAVFCAVLLLATVQIGRASLTGGQATAQVVGVRHAKTTHYTVTFTTEDGRACTAELASDESPELPVGTVVTIRYDEPCLNVWYPGDHSWVVFPAVALVLTVVTWTGAYLAWFRTDPGGRVDWPARLRWLSPERRGRGRRPS